MKQAWNFTGALMLAGLLVQTLLQAQTTPPQKIDVSKLGPQVGQQVPDFNLKDQYGATRNLKSIMGPKGTMLVFIRSADW
jgi:cytochrome oxidase Cu insertion factor (SCO1/SenC/PrrC family)